MRTPSGKEPQKRTSAERVQSREPKDAVKESVHRQPIFPSDDVQARIANRAYEFYVERGYRQGYAVDDWLEAEREIHGHKDNT